MKKIKFRAWDKENKEIAEVVEIVFDQYGGMDVRTSRRMDINASALGPNSLMQFTGLFDKNGKEIYEGDILNSLYKFEGCKGLYEVCWNEDGACFYGKRHGVHQQMGVFVTPNDWTRCEIIGDIYNNPELLK